MYKKAYGIIETLAPLHVGASAGEETGNLNLVFRDQFVQTGIIPGSSVRGRFRADLRPGRKKWLEEQLKQAGTDLPEKKGKVDWIAAEKEWFELVKKQLQEKGVAIADTDGKEFDWEVLSKRAEEQGIYIPKESNDNYWYGHEAIAAQKDGGTTEAQVKFEYASLVWLPVFCPGQPVVWVTCPWLLKRYQQTVKGYRELPNTLPAPYTASNGISGRPIPGNNNNETVLFFNLGFLPVTRTKGLERWLPAEIEDKRSQIANNLVVVNDNDMAMIHDMALYRQSRVRLADDQKKVDGGGFFNVEALPEGSILVLPIALKEIGWRPFGEEKTAELYFGGLESVGFGRCRVTLGGDY